MAFTLTQAPVGPTATSLITVPLGATVVLVASATTSIGTSNSVTTGTGFSLPANVPVTLTVVDELAQAPVTLYGVTGTSSTVSIALTL